MKTRIRPSREARRRAARILREAAKIVEKGWCKQNLALKNDGTHCSSQDPEATQWCALGALNKACNGCAMEELAYKSLTDDLGCSMDLGGWNDKQANKEAVIAAMLKSAKKLTREKTK